MTCCSNAVFTPNEAVRAITGAIINAYELPVQRCVEMAAALLRDVITNCSQEVTKDDDNRVVKAHSTHVVQQYMCKHT